jgi:hypothetical protein
MYYTNLLNIVAFLKLLHNFSHENNDLHNQFVRVARNQQFFVVLRVESFGFGRIKIVIFVEIDDDTFELHIQFLLFAFLSAWIAISDE